MLPMTTSYIEAAKNILLSHEITFRNGELIKANKRNLAGHEQELRFHLEILKVPELERYLVWVPFSRFLDVSELGRGGFSRVHRATIRWPQEGFVMVDETEVGNYRENKWARKFERDFALKEFDETMVGEVVLATHLSYHHKVWHNPTIPLIALSYHSDAKRYLMVMPLGTASLESSPFDPSTQTWFDLCLYGSRLALRLQMIHDLGLLHRDLHSNNVITYRLVPYIIDIGLGTVLASANDGPGIYGRLDYLPPEVFGPAGNAMYKKASDVYCLGTLLWQLVVGVPPRGTAANLMQDGMREEQVPGMLREYEKVIQACWDPDPTKRPSAGMVSVILNSVCARLRNTEERVASVTVAYIEHRRRAYAREVKEAESLEFVIIESSSSSRFYSDADLQRVRQ